MRRLRCSNIASPQRPPFSSSTNEVRSPANYHEPGSTTLTELQSNDSKPVAMTVSPAFLPCTPLKSRKRPLSTTHAESRKRYRVRSALNTPDHPAFKDFQPTQFTPFLSSNPHFQTIYANFYPKPPALEYTRILLNSDDRQAILKIDIANGSSLAPAPSPSPNEPITVRDHTPREQYAHLPRSPPVAVILHGLESNSSAVVTRRIVAACTEANFKSFVLNYRSCAEPDETPTTLRLYHAGFTEDLETLLRGIKEAAVEAGWHPPDVYLSGFSLGANVVCQFLGRQGKNATILYHVAAGAGACVPFDPTSCQQKLDRGWRGHLYSRYLVETMRAKFEAAYKAGVNIGKVIPNHVRRADRIGLIDEYFITPVFGFKDRFDYYQKVDSRKVLKHISVPTLLVNARDDPFFDHNSGLSLPTDEQIGEAPVMLHITDHGGHCGFLDRDTFQKKKPGYFQSEFARFFSSVRQTVATTQDCRTFVETKSPDNV